jgi:hypothetical protein
MPEKSFGTILVGIGFASYLLPILRPEVEVTLHTKTSLTWNIYDQMSKLASSLLLPAVPPRIRRIRLNKPTKVVTGQKRRSGTSCRRSPEISGLTIKRMMAFAGRTLAYPNTSLNGAQGGTKSLG